MIKEGLSGKNTTELMFEERLGVTLTRECNLGQKNCMCKGPEVRSSILFEKEWKKASVAIDIEEVGMVKIEVGSQP